MEILIYENDERDNLSFAKLADLLAEGESTCKVCSSEQREVGKFAITVFTKTAFSKLLTGIKNFFSKNEVKISFKDGEKEINLELKGQQIDVERVFAYMFDSREEFYIEKKNIDRFEKPLGIDIEVGKKQK